MPLGTLIAAPGLRRADGLPSAEEAELDGSPSVAQAWCGSGAPAQLPAPLWESRGAVYSAAGDTMQLPYPGATTQSHALAISDEEAKGDRSGYRATVWNRG